MRSLRKKLALTVALALVGSGCIALFDFDGYVTSVSPSNDAAAPVGGPLVLAALTPFVVHRGARVEVALALERNGVEGAIAVEVTGLPRGVVAEPLLLAEGESRARIVIDAAADATDGIFSALATVRSVRSGVSDANVLGGNVIGTELDLSYGDAGAALGPDDETILDLAVDATGRAVIGTVSFDPDAGALPLHVLRDDGAGHFRTFVDLEGASDGFHLGVMTDGSVVVGYVNRGAATVQSFPRAGAVLLPGVMISVGWTR